MCGIIGYVGFRNASEVVTEGLKRLEYRGYDSVGIAVQDGQQMQVLKDVGMVEPVSEALNFIAVKGNVAIGHSRWATHGVPCKENAHPHSDCSGKIVIAHNGVIENYQELRERMKQKGHVFSSATDSEAIAHLIEEYAKGEKPFDAFQSTIRELRGSYAIVAMINGSQELFVARKNSPLVIGIGKEEMLCASDVPALLAHTKTFIPLEEGDVGVLMAEGHRLFTLQGEAISRPPIEVNWGVEMAQKGGYAYFMLKEIYDQKQAISESMATDVSRAKALLQNYSRVDIVACGTSYHAGLVLKQLLVRAGLGRAEAYIASEYAFTSLPDDKTLLIAISQSGETADTLQAVKWAREKGAKVIALTNVVGSSITRLADEVVMLHAGPEIGVAATKTFTSQLAVIYKLAHSSNLFSSIPDIVTAQLFYEKDIEKMAHRLVDEQNIFFLGRGISLPVAMEGALKLKEISYLHAEAYAGGELKHGPLSLIEEGVPVIVLAPNDETAGKMLGNIKEVKARGATVIALTNSKEIKSEVDYVIPLPMIEDPLLYPFALIIPLQLLAYHVSVLRGINPDRPRNLAKSVTVE